MGDLEVYGNYECDIIKINISEDEVLDQVEKTKFMKLKVIQERSEGTELQNIAAGRNMQLYYKKTRVFPKTRELPYSKTAVINEYR